MLTAYLSSPQQGLQEITTFQKGCWVNLVAPTEAEIKRVMPPSQEPIKRARTTAPEKFGNSITSVVNVIKGNGAEVGCNWLCFAAISVSFLFTRCGVIPIIIVCIGVNYLYSTF